MDPLATTIILLIAAWGVVGPMLAWYMGRISGAEDALKAHRSHPAGKALVRQHRATEEANARWENRLRDDRWL